MAFFFVAMACFNMVFFVKYMLSLSGDNIVVITFVVFEDNLGFFKP